MSFDPFAMLADETRRRLLISLLARGSAGPPVSVPDDVANGHADPDSLYAELYHVHLPKLEAAGVVEWDHDRDAVTRGAAFGEVEPLLQVLADEETAATALD